MARDTIFISHATPEDNEFSIWIASRLEMLGYKTWIDKDGLLKFHKSTICLFEKYCDKRRIAKAGY